MSFPKHFLGVGEDLGHIGTECLETSFIPLFHVGLNDYGHVLVSALPDGQERVD